MSAIRTSDMNLYLGLLCNRSIRNIDDDDDDDDDSNNNNNNKYIYIAQNKQSSDALTRATKQASFQVSGKRRRRQWRDSQICR